MAQKQKKAHAPHRAGVSTASGNVEARAAAKRAKAVLKAIKPASLKTLRNKILKDSIKAFENGKWVRGSLYSDGSVCSIGAIKRFGRGVGKEAQQAAVFALADSIDGHYDNFGFADEYKLKEADRVVGFNDLDDSSARVIDKFKDALKAPLRRDSR